ncbi:DsbA family protein [Actinomycetospora termitidis]|uniref:Thioredoxin domain-containing protein n=1 Tax=Actinomycetospora termitidis TaxID=3053470 RepID=A0ABT7M5A0_9PSEU|nr:thioredoxin domain-containing protein [Actinomycetospora sp. Odt1-22]MDL5155858.1 thioredoxin domain-containing protein [Actinomycetospora sp. Odt1-22]
MGRRGAVAEATRRGSRVPMIVGIVVVAVLAVVIGGVVFTQRTSTGSSDPETPAGSIPITRAGAQFPTQVDGTVVVAGRSAGHTLDVYEDALCPACQQFEAKGGARIAKVVAAGKLRARYHLVNLLDERSQPAGYSTLGANALLCGAENGIFPDLHVSLYTAQPEEGGTGYTADQLIDLGQRLGAGPAYADCVRSGKFTQAAATNFAQAAKDPDLRHQQTGSFGTPALVVDGTMLQPGDDRLDRIAPPL